MIKIYQSAIKSLQHVTKNGMTIMCGGFGLCGIPENLILALVELNVRDLTIISNNCGVDDHGLGLLLQQGQIKTMIGSYVGENKLLEKQLFAGQIEVKLIPQGTLAEKIRAGGAGIPAFYTRTGVGTQVSDGKEIRQFNGKDYLLEECLTADLAIIKGWRADESGNIIYSKTARNFNPVMATAAELTICEVEEILPIGSFDPDHVHTPSIYINSLVLGHSYEKRIEKLTLSNPPLSSPS